MNLGNWLTPASQAVTGYLQGQQQKQQADQQAALQQYAMKRQQEQDDLRQQLETRQRDQQDQNMQLQAAIHGLTPQGTPSRINPKLSAVPLPESPTVTQDSDSSNAEPIAGAAQRQAELQSQDTPGITIGNQRFGIPTPKPDPFHQPVMGSKEWKDAETFKAGLNPKAPVLGSPEWLQAEEAKAKIGAKYRAEPQDHYTAQTITDADGNQHIARFNTKTGELKDTGVGAKAGGQGGSSDAMNTRVEVALAQAGPAHQLMSQFEQDVLAKKASVGPTEIAAARTILHGDPIKSSLAETYLNGTNPRLLEYVKAAKAMAVAERLVTPRGGSNAMMGAEQMLAGVGANPTPGQMQQASQYRQSLIAGLSKGHGPHGKAADPNAELRAHLKATGYTDAEIDAYLAKQQ